MSLSLPFCYKCKKNRTQVYGARFCPDCYYPGLDDDWNRFEDLVAEGHTTYQAKVMAGLQDPDEVLYGE